MNQDWSLDYGGPVFNEIRDIIELASGGYLLAGTYQGKDGHLKSVSLGIWSGIKNLVQRNPGNGFSLMLKRQKRSD